MVLNAAIQALKKAEPLKNRVQHCKDLLNDTDAWVCQQQLQKIYQQVLILDLEYALDQKVEQELWNLGFKNYIVKLQNEAKNRNNPNRSEFQGMLNWCLELASGFYLSLLQEICEAYDLDLPFRRKSYIYGFLNDSKDEKGKQMSSCHKSSCFYMCQYCLVHLGDIARYRNENKQAELFYRHAVSLAPSSGQPYNQLALLEASRGNKLGTVFHYTRSVAVKHPFPVAKTNLEKTLSTLNETDVTLFSLNNSKFNAQEYVTIFLKFHGSIYNFESKGIQEASLKEYVKLLTDSNLTALVATENFTSWKLVQMLVINLFALYQTTGNNLSSIDSLSNQQKISRKYLLDLIGGSFSALLLPVYTFKNNIIDYFALPAIKLYLDWLTTQKSVILEDKAFVSRPQIWPSLCKLLNLLQDCINDTDYESYNKIPLPEDRDLQGFLPLEKSLENYKFCGVHTSNKLDFKKLRAVRILNLGQNLTEYQVNGLNLINISTSQNNIGDMINKVNKFTCTNEGLSNELIKQLEELKLQKIVGLTEKKISGILKPDVQLSTSSSSSSVKSYRLLPSEHSNLQPQGRKIRQNIAMQAIIKQVETEQKQVTFDTLSPKVNNVENNIEVQSPTLDFNNIIPNESNNFSQLLAPSYQPNQFISNTPTSWSPQLSNIYRDNSPKSYLSQNNDDLLLQSPREYQCLDIIQNDIKNEHSPITRINSMESIKDFNGIISNPHQQELITNPLNSDRYSHSTDNPSYEFKNFNMWKHNLNQIPSHISWWNSTKSSDDVQSIQNSSVGSNTFSLFSGNIWGSIPDNNLANENRMKACQQQQQQQQSQSLWAGPGPSPLERLLEQQKSLREGGT